MAQKSHEGKGILPLNARGVIEVEENNKLKQKKGREGRGKI